MNGAEDILSKYGTSLKETRAMLGELMPAIQRRRKAQYPFLGATQYLTAEDVRDLGLITEAGEPFVLEEGWQLKITPGANGAEPSFSFITPEKWEITQDQTYISPEGQRFTREELEVQLATPEIPLEIRDIYGAVFPERDIEEFLASIAISPEMPVPERMRAEKELEDFYSTLMEIGRTEETETILKMLGATEGQIEEFFAYAEAKAEWQEFLEQPPEEIPKYITFGFTYPAAFTLEVEKMPEWARFWTAGVGDLLVTAGGASRWLGHDEIGEQLSAQGHKLQLTSPPDNLGEFEWSLLYNPRFYSQRVMRALPFSVSLLPAAIIGAYAGVWTAGAIGLGTLGKLILGSIGGASLARPLESALEAGGAYDEAIDKGLSVEEAREVANKVFTQNLALVGVDAAQFAVAFAPIPLKVPASLIARGLVVTVRLGGKVVIVGLSEGGEEIYQDIIIRMALGEEIEWDAEMKEVFSIGCIMGMGLGVGGDVFVSIQNRTIDNLTPSLRDQFDENMDNFERVQGLTESQAKLKALDAIAETEEGAKIITEVIEAVKQKELLSQIKPKTAAEQVAWEHMFKDFPEAATLVDVPVTLDSLRGIARLKGYTITELKTPISRMPSAKFRITGEGVRVYARDLMEVENFLRTGSLVIPKATLARMKAELAHALFEASEGRGYFKDVAGFSGVVERMSGAEVRDLHAMFVRTGKITEPVFVGGAYTSEEIGQLEAELAGLKEWVVTEPASKLRSLIKRTGWHKGEISNLTLRQYRILTGKTPSPTILTRDKKHVRWEYALDDVAIEMGYASGEELRYAIENIHEAMARIESLKEELAKITPEVIAEAELQANRERMLEAISKPRTADEVMPRGTVRHPSYYKGREDFTAEVNRELFYPIKDSSLDIAASYYWRRGNFDEYIAHMPDVSELKLRALSDEVRANIAELEELLAFANKRIESLGVEISLEKPTSEKFRAGQREIVQLENDARYCEKIIRELRGGERLTIDDAVALGIMLRTTKGGNLVPAIRRSGFYVTTDFAESPHFRDVSYRSGRWMDTMSMFEAIDGGRAAGTVADPAMAQMFILWPTERTHLARNKFVNTYERICQDIFEKYNLVGERGLIRASFDIIQQIGAEDVAVPIDQLLARPEIKTLVARYRPEVRTRLVGFSQEVRAFLDDLWGMQNLARAKRGQAPIKYRANYLAWIAETNIWSKFGLSQKTPADISQKPPLPDYIKPDAPFNPRAMAREGGMAGYEMERDVHKLLFDYVRTAGKDIFFTNIIQNVKIHIAALRSMGYENSARLIEDWVSEAYGGVKPTIEKAVESFLPKTMTRAAYRVRRNLTRAVFPLNWMWNITIQPSSIAFTVGRYGVRNTIRGLEYLFMPSARAQARAAYAWIIKSRRGGKMAYQDIGAQVERNLKWEGSLIDRAENLANFITNTMESFLTGVSIRAAYHYGEHLGYTGRDLMEYASTGGAKTQSMYNYEDVPGVLRAKPVGTIAPFQTFCFQAFNYIRELNFIGRWKAGAYETISATSAEGKATISRRLKLFVEFLVCIWLINMVVDKTTNRKPWVLSSFIPFYSNFVMGTDATNPWNWPLPVQYVTEFWNAFQAAIKYEDFRRLRKWVIRYHMIGGTQINRMWGGIEAVLRGGVYDVRGTELFEVYPEEWLKAVLMGPYQTEGGREFIDNLQEKQGEWYEYIGIPLPGRVSIKNEIDKNLARLGQLDEEGEFGEIYDFGDFVSDLREIRRAVGDRRFEACDSPFVRAFLEAEESRERYELYVLEHWDGLIPEEIREIGTEPAQGQRDEWRALHPEDDARLAMWGFGGRIQTQEAYDLVVKWCEELGIPMEHLSTWLPPEEIAETYFNYIDAVNEFTAGSAEARLIRLENPEFQAWGKEAYDWKDIDTHIESLRISVKWGEMDDKYDALDPDDRPAFLEANPEYADDRRRRDAYSIDLPENLIEDYVEWHKTPRSGYGDDWFLMEHKDFYDAMVGLEQLEERDFSRVPDIKWRGLWDKWVDLDQQYGGFGDRDSEFYVPDRDRRAEARAELLLRNPQYRKDRRRREAIEYGLPDSLIEDYAGYYEVPPKSETEDSWYDNHPSAPYYEDDWYLLEHPEFYKEMLRLGLWTQRDFSTVPTRAVFNLYKTYLGLPKGQDRLDFRVKHPDLDAWLVLKFGYTAASDRGREGAEKTAWEIAQEALRLKEWLESLFK